jgi:TolB protein
MEPTNTKEIAIDIDGSLQNPAWSPDGQQIILSNFLHGYNKGPANIVLFDIASRTYSIIIQNGFDNVNLPGSIWNANNNMMVYSSSGPKHDELYIMDPYHPENGSMQITSRENQMAYEPSFSPDGQWIVFESHMVDQSDFGVISIINVDDILQIIPLTSEESDCRQPNWSPQGNHIVCQCLNKGQWDIWIMNSDGSHLYQLTSGMGDKTDASFSPDGQWIIFSAESPDIKYSELFIQSISGSKTIQITDFGIYVGAPAWSPDGKKILFEASSKDPDISKGTKIWIMEYWQ